MYVVKWVLQYKLQYMLYLRWEHRQWNSIEEFSIKFTGMILKYHFFYVFDYYL